MRIGIDFGGVILPLRHRQPRTEDTSLDSTVQPPYAGALEGMAQLVERTAGDVWIVSKAGPRMEKRTLEWLDRQDFYRVTGLPRGQVRFCRARQDKKLICEELRISHFVDDRVHLMQILQGTVEHLYRFAPDESPRSTPGYATHVSSWTALLELLG